MNTVNFDFELLDQYGNSLGNCASWVQSWDKMIGMIRDLVNGGRAVEAGYLQDALDQWMTAKEANMENPQYDFVKNSFRDLHVDVLKQVMERFPV